MSDEAIEIDFRQPLDDATILRIMQAVGANPRFYDEALALFAELQDLERLLVFSRALLVCELLSAPERFWLRGAVCEYSPAARSRRL